MERIFPRRPERNTPKGLTAFPPNLARVACGQFDSSRPFLALFPRHPSNTVDLRPFPVPFDCARRTRAETPRSVVAREEAIGGDYDAITHFSGASYAIPFMRERLLMLSTAFALLSGNPIKVQAAPDTF